MIGENLLVKEREEELNNLKEMFLIVYKEHEDLSKECVVLYNRYNLVFGKIFYDRYLLYTEILRFKRKIELYQSYLNREEEIDKNLVEVILNSELKEYEEKLAKILEEYRLAEEFNRLPLLSKNEIYEVKRIYLKIAKRIHPDIDPNFNEIKKDLWQKTLNAYKLNDLETLRECEYILDNFLHLEESKENELDNLDQEIEKLKSKIEKLQNRNNYIVNTFPYDQKELLNNSTLIDEKLLEVKADIELFRENLGNLEKRLKEIDPDYEKEIC
jgi:hypothetical protein